jgi:hypothetical protein
MRCMNAGEATEQDGASSRAAGAASPSCFAGLRGAARSLRRACVAQLVARLPRLASTRSGKAPPRSADAACIASLPPELLRRVLCLLPADVRARCALVCRSWRATLDDARLWGCLDVSKLQRPDDKKLLAASARARGQLALLHVPQRGRVSHSAVLSVARANAGALRELRLFWLDEEDLSCATAATPGELAALLDAAPQLRVCHTRVCTVDDEADEAAAAETHRLLRGDCAFARLRIHALSVAHVDEACMPALTTFVASHATLTRLSIWNTAAVAPVLEAAAHTRRLTRLGLWRCNLTAAAAPALAAVIRGGVLRRLSLYEDAPRMDAPSVLLLASALRASTSLTSLFLALHAWRIDAAAAAALLDALTAHASLQFLFLWSDAVSLEDGDEERDEEDRAAAGAAFGALVAANSPALKCLCVERCTLGDAGLRPLARALRVNTHLLSLSVPGNGMSAAFARTELLPAVRVNASLCTLRTESDGIAAGAAREAEELVARRARALRRYARDAAELHAACQVRACRHRCRCSVQSSVSLWVCSLADARARCCCCACSALRGPRAGVVVASKHAVIADDGGRHAPPLLK